MRLLTFTTLYPNAAFPRHGIFVETRLRQLVEIGGATARVMAPTPWLPPGARLCRRYAPYADVPRTETRHGLRIDHPRYPLVPKVSMSIAPFLIYRWALPKVRRLMGTEFDFDLIDAHYMYPDGVAAVLLGRAVNRPTVVTARGSDLNVLPRYLVPRRLMAWAAGKASCLIAVSEALKERLVGLGAPQDRTVALPNGVDLDLFAPRDRSNARGSLRLQRFTLLSVGNLVPIKGHDIAIRAIALLPDADLLIVGEGSERSALERLARSLDVHARVRFLGELPQTELPGIYAAADALILASLHEGWPNVLLEAMACGTPVVVSEFGSAREIVRSPAAGRITGDRSPEGIAEAVRALRAALPERAETRRYAEAFGWRSIVDRQMRLYERLVAGLPPVQ